jgi:hypothetical protein
MEATSLGNMQRFLRTSEVILEGLILMGILSERAFQVDGADYCGPYTFPDTSTDTGQT